MVFVTFEELGGKVVVVVGAGVGESCGSGRVVHSRKRGAGYVDSPAKIYKIVRAVLSSSQI